MNIHQFQLQIKQTKKDDKISKKFCTLSYWNIFICAEVIKDRQLSEAI